MSTVPPSYPAHHEADVALRDGSTVHVRPIRGEDRSELVSFLAGLSADSRAFRFFSPAVDVGAIAEVAVDVDYAGCYGLIATLQGELVAHASYARSEPDKAEIAFAVADRLQGRGLGTVMLAHLAEAAAEQGITEFVAEVLAENHRMVEVFRESGFPLDITSAPGSIHVELPTSFSAQAMQRFEAREQVAAAAAVSRFVRPASVAVIGASRKRGTVGGELFHNLLSAGFEGPVYPVNSVAEVVQSVRAYPSIAEIPGEVDLAVIAVPAASVLEAARGCGEKGVKALIVISAGFGEAGAEGERRQAELLGVCREEGMRLVGPNCLGVLNTDPAVRLDATFGPTMPASGRVGFLSQSGALGLAMIDLAGEHEIGLSAFASIGNRADISTNDFLDFWESEETTDIALLYLESFGNPRKFSRIARRFGRRKPIVAVKSGRSPAGARATTSHTGALVAASDATVDALFHQAGVIRTDDLAELLDVASLLVEQPLPGGDRVGIVTNAGGPGIMAADACEAGGLEVPPLPPELQASLRRFLPPEASVANPIDMLATASADHYRQTIEVIAGSGVVDALIVIFVRPLLTTPDHVAGAIEDAIAKFDRPLPMQAVFMSERDRRALRGTGVPAHLYPEDAARALARVARYVRWKAEPPVEPAVFDGARVEEAAAIIAEALRDGSGWLSFESAARLLDCYGLGLAEWRSADDPAAAGRAGDALGGSVALKAVGAEIVHKTELGAVAVGLSGRDEVEQAAQAMDRSLKDRGASRDRFVVQRMAAGVEMLVGVVADPLFGPVAACGAGGVEVELLGDVSMRLTPLAERDAGEMIRSLATYPLLTGYRGAPPVDLPALEAVVLRVGNLVENHREVVEIDLNPVLASPEGATIVDARIRIEAAPPRRPWPIAEVAAGTGG